MTRRLAALLAALAVAACQPAHSIVCDEPSPLTAHPRGIVVPGARVGPLLVSTGLWSGESSARLGWDRPEQLSKFLTTRIDRFDSPLTLSGRRCADGRVLRFAEGLPWQPGAVLSDAEIEHRTTSARVIDPPFGLDVQVMHAIAYGGYFVFTAPGRWLIEAKAGDRVLGRAVIEVVDLRTKR